MRTSALATAGSLLLLLTACGGSPSGDAPGTADDATPAPVENPAEAPTATSDQAPDEDSTGEQAQDDASFTIVSAGDVLIHDALFEAAELPGGGYDFRPGLAGVEEWIGGADLALCSMEVPLAPTGEEPTGYPIFGAPEELVPALSQTGFHGCNTANNHSLDRGMAGLQNTLDRFDDHGMGHTGTARSPEEAQQPQLYTLRRADQEITVAHFSTTMIHNSTGAEAPDWAVTDLSAEELSAAAAQARAEGADVVVASVHWGTEYVHEPTAEQRAYGQALADAAQVDLVFGNHSHTPQPIERLEGGPHAEGMWVVWSMGNFFANQDEECCVPETATGTMVYAQVKAPDGEPVQVTGLQWSPVTVDREGAHRGDETHRGIWPLAELIEATEHLRPDADLSAELQGTAYEGIGVDLSTLRQRWDRVTEVMGEEQLRTEPPAPTGEEPEVRSR